MGCGGLSKEEYLLEYPLGTELKDGPISSVAERCNLSFGGGENDSDITGLGYYEGYRQEKNKKVKKAAY